jgi:hypothetical protein
VPPFIVRPPIVDAEAIESPPAEIVRGSVEVRLWIESTSF